MIGNCPTVSLIGMPSEVYGLEDFLLFERYAMIIFKNEKLNSKDTR